MLKPRDHRREVVMSVHAPEVANRIVLDEKEMPTRWYNIQADLPFPGSPPLHPATRQPVGPQDLAPLFPMELIKQEVSQERYIDIPQPVQEALRLWRPTPLMRATRLERELKTTAKIYYKYEGVSPPGSHKPNTAVAQAFYNKAEGTKRLATETGAGQWGRALAFAARIFDLECMVYMVRISYEQKPYRKSMMQVWGATVVPSPSELTNAGRKIRAEHPDSTGSLGIAISEAVEDAATRDDTKYSLGSVLNHVLMHQTIIDEVAYPQRTVFDAAVQFARTEGTIPAPESAHAIRAVIDEAVKARERGESPVILFNLSGHGLLDLAAYDAYFAGTLSDVALSETRIKELVGAL